MLLLAACGGTSGGSGGATPSVPNKTSKINQQGQQTPSFYIGNTGPASSSLSWQISVTSQTFNGENQDWLEVKPTHGSTPGGGQKPVYLYYKDANPAAGTYKATLKITFPSGSQTLDVSATIGGNSEPKVTLNPGSIHLKQGQTSSTITIGSSGFNGQPTYMPKRGNDGLPPKELDISKLSASHTFTVTAHNNAPPGTYQVIITGTYGSQRASATLYVTVTSSGGGGPGTSSIQGTVKTDNAGVSITPQSIGGASAASLGQLQNRPTYVHHQLIVKYRDGNTGLGTQAVQAHQQAVQALAQSYSLTVLNAGLPGQPSLMKLMADQNVKTMDAKLSSDPRVQYAEPNYYVYAQSLPDDTYLNKEWEMPVSGVPLAWDVQNSSKKIVAVIDSGIDLDHPDLSGIFVSDGYDFCASVTGSGDNESCSTSDDNPRPLANSDKHGTNVTGIIAAVGNNSAGVAGVLYGGANILPVKVFYVDPNDPTNQFTDVYVLSQAIRWAAGDSVQTDDGKTIGNPNPAQIINLSLGFQPMPGDNSQTVQAAVSYAQAQGALLIAAAGNGGSPSVLAPASYNGVLAVGSVNSKFHRSCFSNYGKSGDFIMAAGGGKSDPNGSCALSNLYGIYSTIPGNNYGIEVGTSQATPVVSGIAALVWGQHSGWTATRVAKQLEDTAYFDSNTMTADQYGHGIVRADAALGLPGPGDEVSISAQGNGSGVATTTLTASGSPSSFTINNLEAGDYTVTANAQGDSRNLSGHETVSVSAGQTATTEITLTP